MKSLIGLCGFLLTFVLIPGETLSDEQPKSPMTQTVLAEGVGATGDEALKDAFRNAVRQVVGAVVDAETLIKNDELISDKVLTYSGGFVKKYDEISKKEDKGLVRIKIKAQVESKSVVAKLKAANVKVKDVDGKGLFAEVVTELDREKDAAALLKKNLEGFPQNCMTINVIGQPKVIEKNDKDATVAVQVQVRPDAKAYSAFVKRLQPILDKLVSGSSGKGDFLVKTTRSSQGYFSLGDSTHISTSCQKWMPKAFDFNRMGIIDTSKVVLALSTQCNQTTDRLEYKYYLLDKSLKATLLNFARDVNPKLELVDQEGEVIASDRWELQTDEFSKPVFRANLMATSIGSELFKWGKGGTKHLEEGASLFYISPTFIGYDYYYSHAPALHFVRKITLTFDELKKVQKVKVELLSD